MAATVYPNLAAYWMATCPNPPTLFIQNVHKTGGVRGDLGENAEVVARLRVKSGLQQQ